MAGIEELHRSRSLRSAVTRSGPSATTGPIRRMSQPATVRSSQWPLTATIWQDDVVDRGGGMRHRGARGLDDRAGGDPRRAAIDHDALGAAGELEGQAAGTGLGRERQRCAPAHIGHQQGAGRLHALVARMGRVVDRLAAHVVIGQSVAR